MLRCGIARSGFGRSYALAGMRKLRDYRRPDVATAARPAFFADGDMRRSWIGGLLFVLALAFQAAAPVAAGIAMERGSRSSVDVCVKAGGAVAAAENQLPGPHDANGDICALCAFCCSGVAPLEAGPNPVGSAPVQWTVLAWTVADCALPALRHDHARQARAPPSLA